MMGRHEVCKVDELPLGKGREFVIDGRIVAVFRLESGCTAIEGICPHAGGPLAQGMVRGEVVTCPWHGWQFHVGSGQHQLNPRMCVPTYPVTVENETVYVELPDA
jgi:nitrite reductase (NADH) small subunit